VTLRVYGHWIRRAIDAVRETIHRAYGLHS
jgi:hypothetical protein